jgi:uncharacterized protein YjiS (DUF1127 family)
MTDHAFHPSAFARPVASPLTQVAGFARRVCRVILAYRARRALAGLSDKLFEDIGLSRGDIDLVVAALTEASGEEG